MGEVLESCGPHGAVALTHSNCLLTAATPDSRTAVREFYQGAAVKTREDILNPVCYPEDFIAHIPAEARLRSYGCGSPVLEAGLAPGETVLDLGCGTGVECFIAARLVGPGGKVIGVDMLPAMLARASRGAVGVAGQPGLRQSPVQAGLPGRPAPSGRQRRCRHVQLRHQPLQPQAPHLPGSPPGPQTRRAAGGGRRRHPHGARPRHQKRRHPAGGVHRRGA